MKKWIAVFLTAILLCNVAVMPVQAVTYKATTLRLEKQIGTVSISNGAGRALSLKEGSKLYNNYRVQTMRASYVWISLDDTKALKLDANSKVEIQKKNGKLTIYLTAGKLFFNVTKPLKSNESLNIKTSTMVTGIRGTSGMVEMVNNNKSKIQIYDGKVTTYTQEPESQTMKVGNVEAGETAYSVIKEEAEAASGSKADLVVEKIKEEDIPSVASTEIAKNPELKERIQQATTLDIVKIENNAVTAQQREVQVADQKQADIDKKVTEQINQIKQEKPVNPVFEEKETNTTESKPEEGDTSTPPDAGSSSGGGSGGGSTPDPSPGVVKIEVKNKQELQAAIAKYNTGATFYASSVSLKSAKQKITIEVTANIDMNGEQINIQAVAGKTLTLDLNRHTIQGSGGLQNAGTFAVTKGTFRLSGGTASEMIQNSGSLSITDGDFDYQGEKNFLVNSGSLTIKGGQIVYNGSKDVLTNHTYAVIKTDITASAGGDTPNPANNDGIILNNKGRMIVEDGSYESQDQRSVIAMSEGADLMLTAGNFQTAGEIILNGFTDGIHVNHGCQFNGEDWENYQKRTQIEVKTAADLKAAMDYYNEGRYFDGSYAGKNMDLIPMQIELGADISLQAKETLNIMNSSRFSLILDIGKHTLQVDAGIANNGDLEVKAASGGTIASNGTGTSVITNKKNLRIGSRVLCLQKSSTSAWILENTGEAEILQGAILQNIGNGGGIYNRVETSQFGSITLNGSVEAKKDLVVNDSFGTITITQTAVLIKDGGVNAEYDLIDSGRNKDESKTRGITVIGQNIAGWKLKKGGIYQLDGVLTDTSGKIMNMGTFLENNQELMEHGTQLMFMDSMGLIQQFLVFFDKSDNSSTASVNAAWTFSNVQHMYLEAVTNIPSNLKVQFIGCNLVGNASAQIFNAGVFESKCSYIRFHTQGNLYAIHNMGTLKITDGSFIINGTGSAIYNGKTADISTQFTAGVFQDNDATGLWDTENSKGNFVYAGENSILTINGGTYVAKDKRNLINIDKKMTKLELSSCFFYSEGYNNTMPIDRTKAIMSDSTAAIIYDKYNESFPADAAPQFNGLTFKEYAALYHPSVTII